MSSETPKRDELGRGTRVKVSLSRHAHGRTRMAKIDSVERSTAIIFYEDGNKERARVAFNNLEIVPEDKPAPAPVPKAKAKPTDPRFGAALTVAMSKQPVVLPPTLPPQAPPTPPPVKRAPADDGVDAWLQLGADLVDGVRAKVDALESQLAALHDERAAVDVAIDATVDELHTARKRLETLTEIARGLR